MKIMKKNPVNCKIMRFSGSRFGEYADEQETKTPIPVALFSFFYAKIKLCIEETCKCIAAVCSAFMSNSNSNITPFCYHGRHSFTLLLSFCPYHAFVILMSNHSMRNSSAANEISKTNSTLAFCCAF